MLKILWKMGEIAPEEQFHPLSTIFYYLMLNFYLKTGIRFSLRDKRLFEITEVEITRVDCNIIFTVCASHGSRGRAPNKIINKSSTHQYVVVLVSPNSPQAEWNQHILSAI